MINKQLINLSSPASSGGGTGNQEEGLILHLDANDVDSYDGDGSEWVDITNHEYTPATNVDEHFNTVLYDGTGSSVTVDAGFAPDLVWLKRRNSGDASHTLVDTVRGANSRIFSDTNDSESTNGDFSFNSDGTFNTNGVNTQSKSGANHVAWCFKAGGAPSGSDKVSIDGTSYATMAAAGLTDGTEPISKLSVNTKLGFSIVKYTAPALIGDTVAHGIGQTPEMIILKSTNVTRNWNVFHKDVGISKNLHLNTTDSANTSEYWTANSTTFSIQDYSSSADWVAYCFASKRGVSKVGSFTGTGAAGNKIYTGFEPAFIMMKRSSSSGSGWYMLDNKRSTDSDKNDYLAADTNAAQLTSGSGITFNRDGFTFNGNSFNTSGQTHIYYAVAKNTNETSLIPDTDLELHLDAGGDTTVSTSTWSDKTSNNNNVTLTNFSSTLTDFYEKEVGNYIKFDGLNDLATSTLPVTATGDVTMEAWVRFTDSTSVSIYPYITHLGHGNVNGSGFSMARFANTGSDAYKFYNHLGGSYQVSNKVLEEDRWYHVCATWAGTSLKQYVDGELVGNHTLTFNKNLYNAFTVGAYRPSDVAYNHYLKGGLGQVRVYQSALSLDQIRQNYNFTKPSYPNGFDGTINGAAFTPAAGGQPDHFDFDGTDDYITLDKRTASNALSGSGIFDFTGANNDEYTVSMFIKTNDSGGSSTFGQPIIGYNASDVYGQISLKDNKFTYSHYNGSWLHKKSTTSINDSEWHHCVLVHRNDSTIDIYIDNVKEVDNVSGDFTSGRNMVLQTIGKGHSDEFIIMDFGMLKIYNKALTSSEVTAEWNANKGTYGN